MRLDDTQARANSKSVRSQYLAGRALEARLSGRTRQAHYRVPGRTAEPAAADARVKAMMDGQQQVFRPAAIPCPARSPC